MSLSLKTKFINGINNITKPTKLNFIILLSLIIIIILVYLKTNNIELFSSFMNNYINKQKIYKDIQSIMMTHDDNINKFSKNVQKVVSGINIDNTPEPTTEKLIIFDITVPTTTNYKTTVPQIPVTTDYKIPTVPFITQNNTIILSTPTTPMMTMTLALETPNTPLPVNFIVPGMPTMAPIDTMSPVVTMALSPTMAPLTTIIPITTKAPITTMTPTTTMPPVYAMSGLITPYYVGWNNNNLTNFLSRTTKFTPSVNGICNVMFNFITQDKVIRPSGQNSSVYTIVFTISQPGRPTTTISTGSTNMTSSLSGFGNVVAGSEVTLTWTVIVDADGVTLNVGAITAFGNYLLVPTPPTAPVASLPIAGNITDYRVGWNNNNLTNLLSRTTKFTPSVNGICNVMFNFITQDKVIKNPAQNSSVYTVVFTITQPGRPMTTITGGITNMTSSLSGFGDVVANSEVTLTWTVNIDADGATLNVGALNAFGNYLFLPTPPTAPVASLPIAGNITDYRVGWNNNNLTNLLSKTTKFTPLVNGICNIMFNFVTQDKVIKNPAQNSSVYTVVFKISQPGRPTTTIGGGITNMTSSLSGFGDVVANSEVTLTWTVNIDADEKTLNVGAITAFGNYLFLPTSA
jgi:hypothetical protein